MDIILSIQILAVGMVILLGVIYTILKRQRKLEDLVLEKLFPEKKEKK